MKIICSSKCDKLGISGGSKKLPTLTVIAAAAREVSLLDTSNTLSPLSSVIDLYCLLVREGFIISFCGFGESLCTVSSSPQPSSLKKKKKLYSKALMFDQSTKAQTKLKNKNICNYFKNECEINYLPCRISDHTSQFPLFVHIGLMQSCFTRNM